MEYQQAALSKKLANGVGGLSGKHVYDGVFGGTVQSRARKMGEDYREIFGRSSNCSIPILDFPEIKEMKSSTSSGDVRSTKPDYSMIFGGFGEADFAVPYEDLLMKKNKVNSFSKAARSPAETRPDPATAKARHSNISEVRRPPVPEVFPQPLDSGKQFNVSYNKSNQGSKNGTTGMIHIAQLHSVPGYARLIDETTPSQTTDSAKPVRTVLNDAHLNIDVSEGTIKSGKHLRKVVSGPQPRVAANNAPTNHAEFRRRNSRNKSFSNDISFEAYEVGPGTQPSTMSPLSSAPNLGNNKRGSMRSMNSKFEGFKRDYSEGTAGSSSPPFFDEEIDANSDAATSAAALRKAIEEAQAKMKLAKELMEKKRHGFHHRVKSSISDSLKGERREVKAADKANTYEEMHHKVYAIPKQAFISLRENTTKASEVTPVLGNATGETQGMESKCSPVTHRLKVESGKGTNEFSEAVTANEHRVTATGAKEETNVEKMKPCTNENVSKERTAGEENSKKTMQCDKKLKAFDEAPMQEKVERVLNSVASAFKWDIFRNIIKSDGDTGHQEGNEDKTRVAGEHEEAGRIPEVPYQQDQRGPGKEAKSETQDMEENKGINEVKEAEGCVRIEKKETEAFDQEEKENLSNEGSLGEENKRGLQEIDLNKGNEERQKEDWDRVEYENKHDGGVHKENEKRENEVPIPEDTQILDNVHKQDAIEASLNNFQGKEESEVRLREYSAAEGNENLEDAEENEKMLNQINDNGTAQTCEGVETELTQVKLHLREDNENGTELTQQGFRCLYNIEATGDEDKLDGDDTAVKAAEAYEHANLESVQEVVIKVNDNAVDVTVDSFAEEIGKGSNAVEEAYNLVEEDNFGTDDIPEQSHIGLNGIKQQTADVYLGKTDLNFDSKLNGCHLKDVGDCVQERHIEEVSCQLDENTMVASESETSLNEEENESDIASSLEERWSDTGMESNELCGPENKVEETFLTLAKNNEDAKNPGVAIGLEEEIYFEFPSEEKCADSRIGGPASQQPQTFEGEGKNKRTSPDEIAKQSIESKEEGDHETRKAEKRDAEDTLQKKIELEKKHHGRREEMKVREMEKEKERIAVERAIREARERAFAEARERAERAAAEKAAAGAQQRVMAEARERLEKSRAEANGKSLAEKASMEAKLKAERAAVERATAEARERALERALSQKTSLKARNQAEKFGPENFSGVSRDSGLKSTDQQYKGPAPSSGSRDPSSSNQDAPHPTERFNGASGESVERCKATLERNQRTAERAAKALAEKNMRDLLAQKEQAERNRLAEILDAEVKRWSSGKERNLRALLSTLQYILGHDCGWQPIPLTELISTAAVKKAYRKATLFVHPDKLQQRGASIQQKYICEKVFDLLKDGWNKFNAEER